MSADVPVPNSTTPFSADVTRSASLLDDLLRLGVDVLAGVVGTGRLCGSVTEISGVACVSTPRSASVAYAFVISSGFTASVPRVTEHTDSSCDRMPSLFAMSTTCSGPSCAITCANTVLTE